MQFQRSLFSARMKFHVRCIDSSANARCNWCDGRVAFHMRRAFSGSMELVRYV